MKISNFYTLLLLLPFYSCIDHKGLDVIEKQNELLQAKYEFTEKKYNELCDNQKALNDSLVSLKREVEKLKKKK